MTGIENTFVLFLFGLVFFSEKNFFNDRLLPYEWFKT